MAEKFWMWNEKSIGYLKEASNVSTMKSESPVFSNPTKNSTTLPAGSSTDSTKEFMLIFDKTSKYFAVNDLVCWQAWWTAKWFLHKERRSFLWRHPVLRLLLDFDPDLPRLPPQCRLLRPQLHLLGHRQITLKSNIEIIIEQLITNMKWLKLKIM